MTTTTQEKLKIIVRVEHDQDTESPLEDDCFSMISGFNNSEKFQDTLNEFMEDDDRIPGEDFWMLSCYRHGGESWSVLHEGYSCQWDTTKHAGVLYMENPKDRDQWKQYRQVSAVDRNGGFEDMRRVELLCDLNAEKDGKEWTSTDAARSVIETYNRWLSGDCWWYRIEVEEETTAEGCCSKCGTPDVNWYERSLEEQDSCGGFIGLEHVLDEVQSSLSHLFDEKEDADKFDVVLECDDAARCYEGDIEERIKKAGLTLRGEQ